MQDNILKQLMEVVDKKFNLNKDIGEKTFPGKNIEKWLVGETYLNSIQDEVEEVQSELKKNNSVYLEDELGDILWTYINMLYCFEKEGYISQEKVYERCLKKYSQRTSAMESGVPWNEIKAQQKQDNIKEHNKKYND